MANTAPQPSTFEASPSPPKPRIILAATGCVTAMKFAHLCRCFSIWGDVTAVATHRAMRFIDQTTIPSDVKFYTDSLQWDANQLSSSADVLVIAPMSANTLAKIANGVSDNLVTSIVRAWDFGKPILGVPAMNELMWKNKFTGMHIQAVEGLGMKIIVPDTRSHRVGVVAESEDIYWKSRLHYEKKNPKF